MSDLGTDNDEHRTNNDLNRNEVSTGEETGELFEDFLGPDSDSDE